MYSLHLTCAASGVDSLSAELWERGTVGIRELEHGDSVTLIAAFETNQAREEMLRRFAAYSPEWEHEDAIDWVRETHLAWPPRALGDRLFLTPPWSQDETPPGRVRIIHNPGLACGTGEHPCTQLALQALESCVTGREVVIDVGAGSAVLAIAALQLGAQQAAGVDLDIAALRAARENFELNSLQPSLAAGSADCIRNGCSDITIANISGTVLLNIMDDLLRITKENGKLILTGFPESELPPFMRLFPDCSVTAMDEWRCIVAQT